MSERPDMLTWLRSQILARKAAAEAAARHIRVVSYRENGELQYHRIPDGGAWSYLEIKDGYYRGGGRVVTDAVEDRGVVGGSCNCCGPSSDGENADLIHIALNDPQDTIARCEAELAVLALYEAAALDYEAEGVTWDGESDRGRARTRALEEAVRALAWGHRHRPGWLPEWAPEGADAE